MDEPSSQSWFLRKYQDGSVFGPLSFAQLERWASAARIAPHDLVSTDQRAWIKAPMLPELGMDWLVEITSEQYYGPTTLGAVQEFIRLGEINGETFLINSCDGTRRQIREMPMLFDSVRQNSVAPAEQTRADLANEPVASRISIDLQERIRGLEQSLREERRAVEETEQRYQELERKYLELLQQQR